MKSDAKSARIVELFPKDANSSPARQRWRKAMIKLRALLYLRNIQGEHIKAGDLRKTAFPWGVVTSIRRLDTNYYISARYVNGISVVSLRDMRIKDCEEEEIDLFDRVERFFKYIERGSENDLKNMQKMLDLDPKKYTRTPEDPERLINALNKQNESALHVAARNNHVKVLELLLANQANPLQMVSIGPEALQTPLDTATRWRSRDALVFLLSRVAWKESQLRHAKKLAPTEELKALIAARLPPKTSFCKCF